MSEPIASNSSHRPYKKTKKNKKQQKTTKNNKKQQKTTKNNKKQQKTLFFFGFKGILSPVSEVYQYPRSGVDRGVDWRGR
jgi:hypothetical protein